MDAEKKLKEINKNREIDEGCFVMSLWKDPDLYESYKAVNEGDDKTIRSEDGRFYFLLGKYMYAQGFRNFDNVSVEAFLADKPKVKNRFEELGGYREVKEMMSVIDPANADAYFDRIAKTNFYSDVVLKYEEMFENIDKLKDLKSDEVYSLFESAISDASIKSGNSEMIENLVIDERFIDRLDAGETKGLSYHRTLPILNYITLGAMPGSLYMLGGHSGTGKSSLVFEGLIMGLHEEGVKTAIISNEMMKETYNLYLIEHILTRDLRYYDLTRKKIRLGSFTPEQRRKLEQAAKISKERYGDIKFVKTFDNNIGKVLKYMRKLRAQGVQVVVYDTFKSDDDSAGQNMWQSLMLDARKIFQCCSKLGICCITTYQLALHTENYRYLTASCLSNSKQIKEVYETMIYMRPLWDDEYTGEKNDVHPYRFSRDNKKIKEELTLDPNEKYLLLFVDKTRADEDKQVVVLRWRARFNEWVEVGYATVINDHRQGAI